MTKHWIIIDRKSDEDEINIRDLKKTSSTS